MYVHMYMYMFMYMYVVDWWCKYMYTCIYVCVCVCGGVDISCVNVYMYLSCCLEVAATSLDLSNFVISLSLLLASCS